MSGDISLTQLADELGAAVHRIDKATSPLVKSTIEKAADTQRQTVAKRSGKTMRSIRATGPNGSAFKDDTLEGEAGPTWFVGRLLETGTANTRPQPFVSTSLDPHILGFTSDYATAAAHAVFGL